MPFLRAHKQGSRGAARAWRRQLRHIRKGRGGFRRECSAGRRVLWQQEAVRRSPILFALLHDPEAFLRSGEMLKDGNSSTVVRVALEEGSVVLKRHRMKSLFAALRYSLRPSRAWCFLRAAHWLRRQGICAPEVLAVIEQRRFGLPQYSWVVYRFLQGDSLAHLQPADAAPPAALLVAVRELLHALWRTGLVHGDLKASNLLLCGERLCLCDLDALRRRAVWHSAAARRKDVHRFLANWPEQSAAHRAYEKALEPLSTAPSSRKRDPA